MSLGNSLVAIALGMAAMACALHASTGKGGRERVASGVATVLMVLSLVATVRGTGAVAAMLTVLASLAVAVAFKLSRDEIARKRARVSETIPR